jgi:serpin B
MERRQFIAVLTLPAVAQLLAACGEPDDPFENSTKGRRASLQGAAPRVTSGADPAAATAAVNAFGADLFELLAAKDPNANLVFSPASIAIALAMTSAGAKGLTLEEIDGVLHVTDPAGIHRSMNGLTATFDACNKSKSLVAEGGEGEHAVKVSITNSLWSQDGLTIAPAFLDTLSAEYGAGVETVDYANDSEAARVAINEWVADATEDRIPELLSEGVLTAETLLTLVNAVYLKANWANEIYPEATTGTPFTTAAGNEVTAQMMRTGGDLPYAEGDGWQATALPYAFGDLDMVFAVGDTATTPLPDSSVLFPQLASRTVELGLPKFDFATNTTLGDTLAAMGMPTAFSDTADFSGITTEAQLFITDVVHQANITLDEKGTEAAAATAVVMAGTSAPVDVAVVTLDRPFTFWLRHVATGAVLFMGRVNDPTA